MRFKILLCSALLLSMLLATQASVIGIDFGNEWMEVSLVRGKIFDLVLNEQSNRKTAAMMAFNHGDAIYGADAKNLITKQPDKVYTNTFQLLGRSYNDPLIEKVRHFFPYKLEDLNGRYGIPVAALSKTVSVENVVGLILNYARELATKSAGNQVKDCVITVPHYFTEHQRQAVIDAAKIAGLNVLSLLNQHSAIAINFGIERTFTENATNVIFYDMGASDTVATLVSYKTVAEKGSGSKPKKPAIQVQVVESAWDDTLGGREFDRRIALWIVDQVKQQGGGDVSQAANPRAWAKVMREAQRVKEILSANQDVPVAIEGLTNEFDFRGEITRSKFEEISSDLLDRVARPLEEILKKSNIPKEEIQYLEIFGGGLRIPKVQQKMQEYWGKEVDKHINGDEGAVLGAAFYAASQSPSFRVKEFKLKDFVPYSVNTVIKSDSGNLDKTAELFRPHSRYGSKKSLSLHTTEDFTVDIVYDKTPELPAGVKTQLGSYRVTGLPTSEKFNFTGEPKVTVSFRLNNNGMTVFDKAEAEITLLVPAVEETVNATATNSSSNNSTTTTTIPVEEKSEEKSEESSEENSKESSKDQEESTEGTTTEEKEETATEETVTPVSSSSNTKKRGPTTRPHRVTLKVEPLSTIGLTKEEFSEATGILKEIGRKIELKKEKEREKNTLEAYIYETRDKLESNEEVLSVTTEEQREIFLNKLNEVGDWLYDEGEDTIAPEYRSKIRELKQLGDPIFFRVTELTDRNKAIDYVVSSANLTLGLMGNLTSFKNITEEEMSAFLLECKNVMDWVEEKRAKQAEQALHLDPVVTSTEVYAKWAEVEKEAKKLLRRPMKKIPKPEEEKNNTTTGDNTTTTSTTDEEGEDDHEEKEEPGVAEPKEENAETGAEKDQQQEEKKEEEGQQEGKETEEEKKGDHSHDEL